MKKWISQNVAKEVSPPPVSVITTAYLIEDTLTSDGCSDVGAVGCTPMAVAVNDAAAEEEEEEDVRNSSTNAITDAVTASLSEV
jgi:hypothetical protein